MIDSLHSKPHLIYILFENQQLSSFLAQLSFVKSGGRFRLIALIKASMPDGKKA